MNHTQKQNYDHYKRRLDDMNFEEIRGHEITTRGQPKYEINEPDISTYSNFERRFKSQNTIHQLSDEQDAIHSDTDSLLNITDNYYTTLFKKSRTSRSKQNKVLSNVIKQISLCDRNKLDAPLTLEEWTIERVSLLTTFN